VQTSTRAVQFSDFILILPDTFLQSSLLILKIFKIVGFSLCMFLVLILDLYKIFCNSYLFILSLLLIFIFILQFLSTEFLPCEICQIEVILRNVQFLLQFEPFFRPIM